MKEIVKQVTQEDMIIIMQLLPDIVKIKQYLCSVGKQNSDFYKSLCI